jgi:hypothetical protein
MSGTGGDAGEGSASAASGRSALLIASGLRVLEPARLRLWFAGASLRLELADEASWLRVHAARAFPLRHPERFISLRDAAGKEIGLVVDPGQLSAENRGTLMRELERRYLIARITAVEAIRERFGVLEWRVRTDRGPTEFSVKDLREHLVQPSLDRMLLTDAEGNRFEILDLSALDAASQALVRRHT